MIVLDASVLIAYLLKSDAHHSTADRLISRAVAADRNLLINPVTLAEVLVMPTREDRFDQTVAGLEAIGVTETQFPPGAARRLARLRVDTGEKMPNCIVLLTAMDQQATLATFDTHLAKVAVENGVAVWDR